MAGIVNKIYLLFKMKFRKWKKKIVLNIVKSFIAKKSLLPCPVKQRYMVPRFKNF